LDQELTDGKPGNDEPQLEVVGSLLGHINGEEGMINPSPMTTMVPARATRINSFRKVRSIEIS
jgi:hypothetical protein